MIVAENIILTMGFFFTLLMNGFGYKIHFINFLLKIPAPC